MNMKERPGMENTGLLPGIDSGRSVTGYCYQHDLHPDFIPVTKRVVDEWERLEEVVNALESLGKHQLSFRRKDTLPGDVCGDTHLTRSYLWLAGSFPTHDSRAHNWYNPAYHHGPEYARKMHDREHHVRRAMELPTVTASQIADRFGIADSTMWNWLSNRDYRFKQQQRASKRRLGRSILTTAEWGDYAVKDLCKQIPQVPYKTVEDWVYSYAHENEWEVPEEPTDTKWYGSRRE